jgi:hypothetical protein
MPKPSTRRMYAQDQLFHTYGHKVFIDSQMSRVKYIYYINNVSKDKDDSLVKRNNRTMEHRNSNWGSASLELHVKVF